MRIWTIHPKYLDTKGIVALWRETLLAKNVLQGNTKGYINHPQLIRFKESQNALVSINYYLQIVWKEANKRGYKVDNIKTITVTDGQIKYETNHLFRNIQISPRCRTCHVW
ncbi:pyrimidine dimer DNA glycosylase/endonuclease V [Saccharicrinis fermentans]|uniref:Pyrimidine dimer DNA glycosylase n=1 Tax=Saccharicrinis fermentans DSM 9555 = JCM 21142 TaxID=869213 RepID=W7Y360_9BACT|nr:hypothetical protein JCM21142_94002 [Saccharicrinis fermentans DSM 9555 = JCM 21142]